MMGVFFVLFYTARGSANALGCVDLIDRLAVKIICMKLFEYHRHILRLRLPSLYVYSEV